MTVACVVDPVFFSRHLLPCITMCFLHVLLFYVTCVLIPTYNSSPLALGITLVIFRRCVIVVSDNEGDFNDAYGVCVCMYVSV